MDICVGEIWIVEWGKNWLVKMWEQIRGWKCHSVSHMEQMGSRDEKNQINLIERREVDEERKIEKWVG